MLIKLVVNYIQYPLKEQNNLTKAELDAIGLN